MRKVSEILASFRNLPEAGLETLLQGQKPLILAPHPDDESLGAGGLIAAACAAGTAPVVIILTDGGASHPGSCSFPPPKLAQLREAEALHATSLLGLPRQNLYFFRQPDGQLAAEGDAFGPMVRQAAAIGTQHGCGLVIGPWGGDPHCDHEAAAAIAAALAEHFNWRLLSYPVWGWLRDGNDFFEEQSQSGWRLDIRAWLPQKAQAIAAHASQYGDLISDSPTGFRLPPELLEIFARNFEVFIA
jgi:LmbE family N-acetylglucosaminyl deacetylase